LFPDYRILNYLFRYFSKVVENPPDEETEVRRNLECLLEPSRVETAFESVLAIERSLIALVDEKSRSSPVVVFRDESNEIGVFELLVELVDILLSFFFCVSDDNVSK
jgi:hypothetical protein